MIFKSIGQNWCNNVNVLSVWFTHSAGSSQVVCVPLHKVRGFGNWDLGVGFIIIIRPWDIMGLSLSTEGSWGTLIGTSWVDLGVLNSYWLVFSSGGVCCMLGGLAATLDWAVDWGLGGLAAILSTSAVSAGLLLSMVGVVGLTGRGASMVCILFCLRKPFGLFTKYKWGISALDRTSPEIDHFLVWGSCSLTGCVGRSCGSSLVCASYLPCICLVCGKTSTVHCWSEAWLLGGWSSAVYSAVTQQSSVLLKRKLISFY